MTMYTDKHMYFLPVKANGLNALFPIDHEGSMLILVGAIRTDN